MIKLLVVTTVGQRWTPGCSPIYQQCVFARRANTLVGWSVVPFRRGACVCDPLLD